MFGTTLNPFGAFRGNDRAVTRPTGPQQPLTPPPHRLLKRKKCEDAVGSAAVAVLETEELYEQLKTETGEVDRQVGEANKNMQDVNDAVETVVAHHKQVVINMSLFLVA